MGTGNETANHTASLVSRKAPLPSANKDKATSLCLALCSVGAFQTRPQRAGSRSPTGSRQRPSNQRWESTISRRERKGQGRVCNRGTSRGRGGLSEEVMFELRPLGEKNKPTAAIGCGKCSSGTLHGQVLGGQSGTATPRFQFHKPLVAFPESTWSLP